MGSQILPEMQVLLANIGWPTDDLGEYVGRRKLWALFPMGPGDTGGWSCPRQNNRPALLFPQARDRGRRRLSREPPVMTKPWTGSG
jgi:hypothetical protein